MRWFKHDTDAFTSEGVDALIDAEGFAGYGRWMRLLEIVAFKMDETDRCYVEYSYKKWSRLLGLRRNKLISFLTLTELELKTKVTLNHNKIRIEIPNLLNKRDNYTRDKQQTSKTLPSIDREVEVEVDKEEDKKKKKGRRFAPPTVQQVEEYGQEIGYEIDGNKFVDSYTTTGWKLKGGNAMKDWKAAVRTWKNNGWGRKEKDVGHLFDD